MAIYADRVKETTATTGTGTYSLAGAAVGHQTFIAGVGTGKVVHYTCENGTDWEVGQGTVTGGSPDTLTRSVILASSNSDAAVSWSAGSKNIFLTIPAKQQNQPLFEDYLSVDLGTGNVRLIPGDGTGTGYVEFSATNGNRQGYIGYSLTNTTPGTLPYVATLHEITGNVTISGTLGASGTTSVVALTATGLVSTPASASGSAGLRLPHGTAPSSPTNGDLWTTSSGLFARVNSTTIQLAPLASPTFTGTVNTSALTVGGALTSSSSTNTFGGSGAFLISTSGTVSVTGAVLQSTKGFAAAEYSAGSGAPGTITWSNGQNQVRTLTSSGTMTFASPTAGATYKLRIVQGGSGSYTITWPTIKWAGGSAPTLSTSVGAIDIVTLYYNGTDYFGQASTGFA